MKTKELLEAKLLKEREDKDKQEHSHKYYPSSFGRCLRYQYWQRQGEIPSNPISVDVLKIFALGNLCHDLIQSLYPKEQCEVTVEIDDVRGRADIVLDDTVIDIKSIRAFEYKLMQKIDYNINDKVPNILQACFYAYHLNKPKFKLVFVEKEALNIKEFDFETASWEKKLEDELTYLRYYWDKKELPEGKPRAYGGKECNYCVFRDTCFKLDGNKLEGGK